MGDFLAELKQVKYAPPQKTKTGKDFKEVERCVVSIVKGVKESFFAQARTKRHLSRSFSFYASIHESLPFSCESEGSFIYTHKADVSGSRKEIDFFFDKLVENCSINHIKIKIYARGQSLDILERILWGGVYFGASGLKYLALAWPNVHPTIEFYMDV